ncbi:hypothetical protein GZH46_01272, partial [Fragariocoptes setiger]
RNSGSDSVGGNYGDNDNTSVSDRTRQQQQKLLHTTYCKHHFHQNQGKIKTQNMSCSNQCLSPSAIKSENHQSSRQSTSKAIVSMWIRRLGITISITTIFQLILLSQHSVPFAHGLSLVETASRGQNRCPAGWLWFNNKCWVTTQSRRSFVHAIELCRKMYFNSTLPTIHSEEENEFLRNNIELHNSPIWLYSRHNHQYNRTRWLDKSPVNYTRWDNGQPSDKSSLVCIKTEESWYMKKADPVEGQTECVSFWEDAKWGTQVGCQVLLPVVCEMKLPPIKRGANETSTPAELITPYYAGHSSSLVPSISMIYLSVVSLIIVMTNCCWSMTTTVTKPQRIKLFI